MNSKKIDYPYMREDVTISYLPASHPIMVKLKEYSRQYSLDSVMPNASLVMLKDQELAIAANGSDYHQTHECVRVKLNLPTGQGYELCEGCHPKNHSESKCVAFLKEHKIQAEGAELYLWGHWWCCEYCWSNMLSVGIEHVNLLEDSEILFNKTAPGNIVGKQFSEE